MWLVGIISFFIFGSIVQVQYDCAINQVSTGGVYLHIVSMSYDSLDFFKSLHWASWIKVLGIKDAKGCHF